MKIYYIIFLLLNLVFLQAQDPAYTSFNNNRLLFNPSLVGATGAQSWKARLKSQWWRDGGGGYKTIGIVFEETVPCSIVDGGFKFNLNEEGRGLYRTFELGPLFAITVPSIKQFNDHNIRIGTDLGFGYNSIDYDRLVWSDQLDPKYGIVKPTNFVAPNNGTSAWFFNPGLGVSWKALWNKSSSKAVMTNMGFAMYRFWPISDQLTNQSISVLGFGNPNNLRFTSFAEMEFIPFYYGRKYLSFRPGIFYQKQGKLDYIEAGCKIQYTRGAALNVYYHNSVGNEFGQTKWITAGTDFIIAAGDGKRIELNLNWSENIGGLQNFSGSQFEVGFTYHLAKSTICNILKLDDDVPYGSEYRCPIIALTPGRKKMYENIWYKN